MAYKFGNRNQLEFLPIRLEDYVSNSHPVRVYDAFVDALNMTELGIEVNHNKVGHSSYDPITMLKVLIYSYSYGWRSSRKIERALYDTLPFIWLAKGLKPDHKTIANFRKNNLSALKEVLKQCVRICVKLDLIEGNILFFDGSKIRANAGNNSTYSKGKLAAKLARVDARIDKLLDEIEFNDDSDEGSLVKIENEICQQEKLKEKIVKGLAEIKDAKRINLSDPDSKIMKGRQGSHPCYNAQIGTDDLHGLIVSATTVSQATDHYQLQDQVIEAEKNLERQCKVACADAGYFSTDALQPLVVSPRTIIVPNQKQAEKNPKPVSGYEKDKFVYDPQTDTYTCPHGEKLSRGSKAKERNKIPYRMTSAKTCSVCEAFGECTTAKRGRTINRMVNENIFQKLKTTYEKEDMQQIYNRRKTKVELQFGHVKRNQSVQSFLIRGLEATKAELCLLASCFNITRMINILGGVLATMQRIKT